MPPKKKLVAAKKPPAKKPAKKPSKKPKHRAPVNRNTNSVRVHIINGGETAPPPYSGPDRGSFAFNPVFDMGGTKAPMLPPMNSGVALSASPVNRVAEMQTQTGDGGIFDRFAAGVNPSMGTGTFEAGESSQQIYDDMNMNQLKDIASRMGLKIKKKSKIQLAKDIKEAMRNG